MEQIVQQMIKWLQQKVNDANAKGLLVGLSGGLDSAVVAHLIKRAFPDHSLAVIMPIQSNPVDLTHAKEVAKSCNIQVQTVDLTETHSQMMQVIKTTTKAGEWNEAKEQIADANLRARLRMSTLYTIATNYNYLVTGTDNLAEWYTGYFTKYGDGGVDLQPIIDLTKREVADLARYLGVPEAVIEKQPSADLWTGQTDEEEMGTTYEMIDNYLDGIDIPEKERELIEGMHRRTAHKRQMPPQFKRSN